MRCPLNLAPLNAEDGELYQEDRDGAEVIGRVLAWHTSAPPRKELLPVLSKPGT